MDSHAELIVQDTRQRTAGSPGNRDPQPYITRKLKYIHSSTETGTAQKQDWSRPYVLYNTYKPAHPERTRPARGKDSAANRPLWAANIKYIHEPTLMHKPIYIL